MYQRSDYHSSNISFAVCLDFSLVFSVMNMLCTCQIMSWFGHNSTSQTCFARDNFYQWHYPRSSVRTSSVMDMPKTYQYVSSKYKVLNDLLHSHYGACTIMLHNSPSFTAFNLLWRYANVLGSGTCMLESCGTNRPGACSCGEMLSCSSGSSFVKLCSV